MVLLNSKLKTQNLKLEDKGLEIEGKKRRGRLEGEWVLSETEKNNLQFVRVTENGLLDLKDLKNKLKPSNLSKLLVLTHVSNVLGTINPVREIIKKARAVNPKIKVLVDAAQSVPHLKVDVQSLDCDFLVFSGHKMLGPMGIGVLYVKEKVLTGMQPFLTGGDMVQEVHFGNVVWNSLPFKFEAGTANVGGAVGLAAAIDYLRSVGVDKIHQHEQELVRYFLEKLCQAGFRWSNPNSLSSPRPLVLRNGAGNQSRTAKIDILGPMDPLKRAGLVAFRIPGITAHDLAAFLDTQGVAVRSGFHCAQPLHEKFGFNKGSVRVSFYLYNTTKEVDKLVAALQKAVQILS